MGMNYYSTKVKCEYCNNIEYLHIGKKSVGWRFVFKSHPDKGIVSYRDWIRYLHDAKISYETNEEIEHEKFFNIVEKSLSEPRVASHDSVAHFSCDFPFMEVEFC